MTNFDVITRKHVFFKNQNIIDVTVKISKFSLNSVLILDCQRRKYINFFPISWQPIKMRRYLTLSQMRSWYKVNKCRRILKYAKVRMNEFDQ